MPCEAIATDAKPRTPTAEEVCAMPRVSVIIIGRNEASHIERCLRSVFASLDGMEDYEIIYADSASDDDTVEIAKQFPIRILQLKRQWKLTASAGRYIGYQHATGDYLLFVDGDTILYKRWLAEAICFLDQDPACGGVAGIVHEAFESTDGKCIAIRKNYFGQTPEVPIQAARSLGGIALYRRTAMDEAGTFNPYLPTGEEWEVAFRIRQCGYKLARMHSPMCLTYAPPRESVREVLRRRRSRLYDYGVTLRYCLANGYALRYSYEQLWFFYTFIAAVLASGLAVVAAVLTNTVWLLGIWALIAVLYVAFKKRDIHGVLISLAKRSLVVYCTLVSFFRTRPQAVESYPRDAILVQ